jgi:hypothetical protein
VCACVHVLVCECVSVPPPLVRRAPVRVQADPCVSECESVRECECVSVCVSVGECVSV